MSKSKHAIKGVMAAAIFSFAGFATAFTAGPASITITSGSLIAITSPLGGTYKASDAISVQISAKNAVGPLYLYLFDPSRKKVVATSAFGKSALSTVGDSSLRFDLAKSKASSSIAPGIYRIAACDMGVKSVEPACALSGNITISSGEPKIISVDPGSIYPGTSAVLYGAGFDGDTYLLVDGGWNSLATLKIKSDDSALVTFLPGFPTGSHNIQIARRGQGASKAVAISVLEARAPSISSVARSGAIFTVTGGGLSRAYPSTVEVLSNGSRVAFINPALQNGYAISEDGTTLRFRLEGSVAEQNGLSIRVINSDAYKSNILPLPLR